MNLGEAGRRIGHGVAEVTRKVVRGYSNRDVAIAHRHLNGEVSPDERVSFRDRSAQAVLGGISPRYLSTDSPLRLIVDPMTLSEVRTAQMMPDQEVDLRLQARSTKNLTRWGKLPQTPTEG